MVTDKEYQRNWRKENPDYGLRWQKSTVTSCKSPMTKRRKNMLKIKEEEENINASHLKTIFACGEPNEKELSLGVISYEYSEGFIL